MCIPPRYHTLLQLLHCVLQVPTHYFRSGRKFLKNTKYVTESFACVSSGYTDLSDFGLRKLFQVLSVLGRQAVTFFFLTVLSSCPTAVFLLI